MEVDGAWLSVILFYWHLSVVVVGRGQPPEGKVTHSKSPGSCIPLALASCPMGGICTGPDDDSFYLGPCSEHVLMPFQASDFYSSAADLLYAYGMLSSGTFTV